jgi:hypothetical protein
MITGDRGGFRVQAKQCETCIYRNDSPLSLKKLEADVADGRGGFRIHRQCHHSDRKYPVCCRGFWDRHKDEFPGGQLAQRLNMVDFVEVDCEPGKKKGRSESTTSS